MSLDMGCSSASISPGFLWFFGCLAGVGGVSSSQFASARGVAGRRVVPLGVAWCRLVAPGVAWCCPLSVGWRQVCGLDGSGAAANRAGGGQWGSSDPKTVSNRLPDVPSRSSGGFQESLRAVKSAAEVQRATDTINI